MSTKAIASMEKTVLSVAKPIAKKLMPSRRKYPEALRLLIFIGDQFFGLTSG